MINVFATERFTRGLTRFVQLASTSKHFHSISLAAWSEIWKTPLAYPNSPACCHLHAINVRIFLNVTHLIRFRTYSSEPRTQLSHKRSTKAPQRLRRIASEWLRPTIKAWRLQSMCRRHLTRFDGSSGMIHTVAVGSLTKYTRFAVAQRSPDRNLRADEHKRWAHVGYGFDCDPGSLWIARIRHFRRRFKVYSVGGQ